MPPVQAAVDSKDAAVKSRRSGPPRGFLGLRAGCDPRLLHVHRRCRGRHRASDCPCLLPHRYASPLLRAARDGREVQVTRLKVKVGIVGIGNSASTFIQGLRHYGSRKTIEGLWHPRVGGLSVGDIEVVAAFDIDSRKVELDLSEAIFAKPNVRRKYLEVPKMGVEVQPGLSRGDLPPHLSSEKLSLSTTERVSKDIATSAVPLLLNLISCGTPRSSLDYANAAAEAGGSFVNCTPNTLVSRPTLAKKISKAKICLAGDDLMSQFGGTIFHKGLLSTMVTT